MPELKSDVLIIGAGIAGLVAAYECLNRGKSVHIIERERPEKTGGLAKWAFGGMALVDTPVQRRMKIQDSPEIALEDWHSFAAFGPEDVWPKKWAQYYVEHSRPRVYDFLIEKGCRFMPAVNWVERGLNGDGNTLPRYHILWGTGKGLVDKFVTLIENHPARKRLQFYYQHRCEDLNIEGNSINACMAIEEVTGQEKVFSADSVIVATGGINGSLAKVVQNWDRKWSPVPDEILNGAHPFADGHLHDVIARQGGRVTHLDKMWNYAAGIPHPNPEFENQGLSLIPCKSALWLDHTGTRIGPEPLVTGFDTNDLCRQVARQQKPYTWQLLNWRIAAKEFAVSGAEHNPSIRDGRLFAFLKEILLGNHRLVKQMQRESDHFIVADTLPELVAKMNKLNGNEDVSSSTVEGLVKRHDEMLARGEALWNDDQIRRIQHARAWRPDRMRTCKPEPLLKPGAGPLIAIKVRLITRKSLGGIQTDLQSRVLDESGQAIRGLFAVGEAAGFGGGGASGFRSLEGTFLSGCILTARAAAEAIN